MRCAHASVLLVAAQCAACVPMEDRPLYARSRTTLTGETTTDRPAGAYPYPEEIRRLRQGMSKRAVYLVLGEPRHRLAGPQTVWTYGEPGGRQLLLTFDADRLVLFD